MHTYSNAPAAPVVKAAVAALTFEEVAARCTDVPLIRNGGASEFAKPKPTFRAELKGLLPHRI